MFCHAGRFVRYEKMDWVGVFYLTRLNHHPSASSSAHRKLRTVGKWNEWSARVVGLVDGAIYLHKTNCTIRDTLTPCGLWAPFYRAQDFAIHFLAEPLNALFIQRLLLLFRIVYSHFAFAQCVRELFSPGQEMCVSRRSSIQIGDRKHKNRQNFSSADKNGHIFLYSSLFVVCHRRASRLWPAEEHIIR